MRDHKIDTLQNNVGGKGSKKNQSKGKSFGYQILGFGSGGSSLAPNPFTADYLMVAGGGSGRGGIGGGGGAGGLLYSYCNSCAAGIGLDAGLFNITIGAGGSAGLGSDTTIISCGALACISKTATRGGHGPGGPTGATSSGGSGSGGGHQGTGGSGNTPPVSVPLGGPQGNNGGGAGGGNYAASGGGGRGGAGTSSSGTGGGGGAGGVGLTGMSISGSPLSYAGGGGGGAYNPGSAGGASPCGTGGAAIPGTGPGNAGPSNNGTTNRGGGGGGNGESASTSAPKVGSGGSGIVILRYPDSISATIAPGTNTIACAPGSTKIATFTVTGTLCVAGG